MKRYPVFLEFADDWVTIGPLTIEWHPYLGPTFLWFDEVFYPRRYSPVWLLFNYFRKKRGWK